MGDQTISVSCPEPLKAEVGQSEECSDVDYLLHGHVRATITAIHNGNPEYKLMVVD
jgi:thiamine monophosphate synthase